MTKGSKKEVKAIAIRVSKMQTRRKLRKYERCISCNEEKFILGENKANIKVKPIYTHRLYNTVFGRHRRDFGNEEDIILAKAANPEEYGQKGFHTPKQKPPKREDVHVISQHGELDAKTGVVQSAMKKRERRKVASFDFLITAPAENKLDDDYLRAFNVEIWKVDHGTPVKPSLRGPIATAHATPFVDEKLVPVEETYCNIYLTKKSLRDAKKRYDPHRNQNRVMGLRSAISTLMVLQQGLGIKDAEKGDAEWSHLIGHRFVGEESQDPKNLGLASACSNSQTEAFEAAIWSIVWDNEINIRVRAYPKRNPEEKKAHVLDGVYYEITFDNGHKIIYGIDGAAQEKLGLSAKRYFYSLLKNVYLNPKEAHNTPVPKELQFRADIRKRQEIEAEEEKVLAESQQAKDPADEIAMPVKRLSFDFASDDKENLSSFFGGREKGEEKTVRSEDADDIPKKRVKRP